LNEELKEIIQAIKSMNCSTVEDGLEVLNEYFDAIEWSLTQEEWTKMSITQRKAFVQVVLKLKV
jgi:hypothetical protein